MPGPGRLSHLEHFSVILNRLVVSNQFTRLGAKPSVIWLIGQADRGVKAASPVNVKIR